jgi:hypothetical protein
MLLRSFYVGLYWSSMTSILSNCLCTRHGAICFRKHSRLFELCTRFVGAYDSKFDDFYISTMLPAGGKHHHYKMSILGDPHS